MPTNTNPAAATLSTTSREKRCRSFPIVPLDTVQGQTYTVIQSTLVLNGPFAYNGDTLSPEDVKAIQELFTSDEVANDSLIFYTEDSGEPGLLEKKSDQMRFVTVEDSWYDPIRNMQS